MHGLRRSGPGGRRWLALGAMVTALGACGSDDAPPPSIRVTAAPTTFASGGSTTLTVEVENFELRAPVAIFGAGLRTAHGGDLHEGVPPLSADGGHYHVYLNTTGENPLRQAWHTELDVEVTAEPGPHTLIVRLSADDHRFLNPEVLDEVPIVLE